MREARVAFVTLGCKVNQTESEAIAESLGVRASATVEEEADLVVINTCTVTAEADHKARKAVRHALALPLSPIVVVTGCLAVLNAEALQGLGDRVIVEADKALVASRVRSALDGRTLAAEAHRETRGRSRKQLKIEDGCDEFCTYCIVPHARGVPRPVPFEEIVRTAERLAVSGTPEVVLTGINIGRYEDEGRRLPQVLMAVAAAGIPRVRVSSIEPGDLTDEFLEVAMSTSAFCRHLHVPLQSGSDGVLQRMGRPYDSATYSHTVARTRRALPGVALTTDVIVGFPGETDVEFAETLAFVEHMSFSRLHVFRYSARPGTPAATMPGQVSAETMTARAGALRQTGERLAERYVRSQVGHIAELLVERVLRETDGGGRAEGTTREYLRLEVPLPATHVVCPGDLVRVLVEGTSGTAVRGRLAE